MYNLVNIAETLFDQVEIYTVFGGLHFLHYVGIATKNRSA